MTLLVGSNSTGTFTTTDQYSNAAIWYKGYVASVSGNATTLFLYSWDDGNASNMKLAIWDSSGVLLAASSPFISTGGGGAATWYSASIASTAITAGQTYYLGFCADGYVGCMDDGAISGKKNATNSYPTVNNVSPGTDTADQTILMYADGTTAAAHVPYMPYAFQPTMAQ